MKLPYARTLLVSVLAALPLTSRAITVVSQTSQDSSIQVEYFEPIGQSFTAAGNKLLNFEFFFLAMNSFLTNTPLTLDIRDGAGVGGTILGSATLNLTSGFYGWAGSAFNIDVVTGQQYTATLDTSSPYWGIGAAGFDAYVGGVAYTEPGGYVSDLMFSATFDTQSVPDSTMSAGLLGAGLMALAAFRRRTA